MRELALGCLVALFISAGACGGTDDEDSQDERAEALLAVAAWVNRNDCDAATDRLIEAAYPADADPRAACRRETLEGLRKGDYRVQGTTVDGDTATVTLKLDTDATRTYTVLKQDGRWLVDDLSEQPGDPRTTLGKPLEYFAPLELNDRPIDARLRVTVLSFERADAPPYYPSQGGRWYRARARVKSDSSGPFSVSVSDFSLVDGRGQRAQGNSAFEPRLGHDSVTLSPGDVVTGYVGFELPRGSRPKEVRYLHPASTDQAPMVWTLRS